MIPKQTLTFLSLGLASWLGALVYGYGTGGDRLGPVTVGWWGGIGDPAGYAVLLSGAAMFLMGALVLLSGRDATDDEAPVDPTAAERIAPVSVAAVPAPAIWPFVAAAGLAVITVGLVTDFAVVGLGGVICLGATVGWSESGARERSMSAVAEPVPSPSGPSRPLPTALARLVPRIPAVVVALGFVSIVSGLVKNSDGAMGVVAGIGAVVAGAIGASAMTGAETQPDS